VNEDASSQMGAIELGPPTTTSLIRIISSLPGELDAGPLVVVATVHPPFDHPELEFAGLLVCERQMAGHLEVDEVRCPQLHLGDPPTAEEARVGRTSLGSNFGRATVCALGRHRPSSQASTFVRKRSPSRPRPRPSSEHAPSPRRRHQDGQRQKALRDTRPTGLRPLCRFLRVRGWCALDPLAGTVGKTDLHAVSPLKRASWAGRGARSVDGTGSISRLTRSDFAP
jgi:hypothetical protein